MVLCDGEKNSARARALTESVKVEAVKTSATFKTRSVSFVKMCMWPKHVSCKLTETQKRRKRYSHTNTLSHKKK